MTQNMFLKNIAFTLICFIPAVYLLAVWSDLPAIVPTHFGLNGPDQYKSKEALRTLVLVLSAITAGVYFIVPYIYKIDPMYTRRPQVPLFGKMATGIALFLSAINIMLIYTALHTGAGSQRIVMVLAGLFFAFMGNIMYSLKPSYFVGIKLPWTLSSEYNWRKTHQVAGVLWFIGGILLTIASLAFGYELVSRIMLFIVAVFVVVPIGYSYLLFRKEQANPGLGHGTGGVDRS